MVPLESSSEHCSAHMCKDTILSQRFRGSNSWTSNRNTYSFHQSEWKSLTIQRTSNSVHGRVFIASRLGKSSSRLEAVLIPPNKDEKRVPKGKMVSKSLNCVTEKKLKNTYRILKYPAHTRVKTIT